MTRSVSLRFALVLYPCVAPKFEYLRPRRNITPFQHTRRKQSLEGRCFSAVPKIDVSTIESAVPMTDYHILTPGTRILPERGKSFGASKRILNCLKPRCRQSNGNTDKIEFYIWLDSLPPCNRRLYYFLFTSQLVLHFSNSWGSEVIHWTATSETPATPHFRNNQSAKPFIMPSFCAERR